MAVEAARLSVTTDDPIQKVDALLGIHSDTARLPSRKKEAHRGWSIIKTVQEFICRVLEYVKRVLTQRSKKNR